MNASVLSFEENYCVHGFTVLSISYNFGKILGTKANLHTQNSGDVNTHLNGVLKKKEIKDYLDNKATKEFLSALMKEENLNGENSPYLTSRGKYSGGTWMHPICKKEGNG